jgi:hypothetical protein
LTRPARWLVVLVLTFAVVGGLAFGLARGPRSATSFLAGLAVATATVTMGAALVEIAGRIAPALAMIAALSNYALTVLFFLVLLRSISPSSADIPALATGLGCSVVPYLAWQFAKARPRR